MSRAQEVFSKMEIGEEYSCKDLATTKALMDSLWRQGKVERRFIPGYRSTSYIDVGTRYWRTK